MSATATQALVIQAATDFGTAFLAVLGATIVIGVGYLVFRKGWQRVKGSLK